MMIYLSLTEFWVHDNEFFLLKNGCGMLRADSVKLGVLQVYLVWLINLLNVNYLECILIPDYRPPDCGWV